MQKFVGMNIGQKVSLEKAMNMTLDEYIIESGLHTSSKLKHLKSSQCEDVDMDFENNRHESFFNNEKTDFYTKIEKKRDLNFQNSQQCQATYPNNIQKRSTNTSLFDTGVIQNCGNKMYDHRNDSNWKEKKGKKNKKNNRRKNKNRYRNYRNYNNSHSAFNSGRKDAYYNNTEYFQQRNSNTSMNNLLTTNSVNGNNQGQYNATNYGIKTSTDNQNLINILNEFFVGNVLKAKDSGIDNFINGNNQGQYNSNNFGTKTFPENQNLMNVLNESVLGNILKAKDTEINNFISNINGNNTVQNNANYVGNKTPSDNQNLMNILNESVLSNILKPKDSGIDNLINQNFLKMLISLNSPICTESSNIFQLITNKVIEKVLNLKENDEPKYNMKIQREIHDIQNKSLIYKCPGGKIISFDGPGIECTLTPTTTGISLNQRFA